MMRGFTTWPTHPVRFMRQKNQDQVRGLPDWLSIFELNGILYVEAATLSPRTSTAMLEPSRTRNSSWPPTRNMAAMA